MSATVLARRLICLLCSASILLAGLPVAAQDRPLGRSGTVKLIAPDVVGGWCGPTATVKALTPTPPDFTAEDAVTASITRALGTSLAFECPAARRVRIEGTAETGQTFIAAAEAANGWRLLAPGAAGSGPVEAQIDVNGFMPTHWTGIVNVRVQQVTRDAIRDRTQTAQAGLYPQQDGRIRVSLGRCEGELAVATIAELQSADVQIGAQDRLYKIVTPSRPFLDGGGNRPVCSATSTTTNWLALSTTTNSVISFRAILRDVEDRTRRDRATVETIMGALNPVYPAVPQTIAEANASASSQGPDWVGAGMLLMVGLLAASMWPGGGFSSGGSSSHEEAGELAFEQRERERNRPPEYTPAPLPPPIAPLYGDRVGGSANGW